MDKHMLGTLVASRCGMMAALLLFAPVGSAQVVELRPNLQPFPPYDLVLIPTDSQGGTRLIFSTTSWNSGLGPLELRAGEIDPVALKQKVYQRVYNSDGSYVDYYAGSFDWHPEHNHFHFNDYALYTLQPFDAPGGSQRTGSKTTFCIMDTNKVNTSLAGAPSAAVYTTCGADVQGMSVGWGDTYGNYLWGQWVDFTGNPSGVYRLSIEIDPKTLLLETNENDNIACAHLYIDAVSLAVSVLSTSCDPSGLVIVSGIQPNAWNQSSAVDVTIAGSGFAPGMQVRFENGSGARPSVSNVAYVDSSTITARVTLKKAGRDRVWDLRVGSGVLPNAFTVLP